MNAILEWLKHSTSILGLPSAPAWALIAIIAGVVVEYLLGRFAPTSCASLIALIATGLRLLLAPFVRVPGIGPVVRFLESVAGVDLDGDGRVGAEARAGAIARNAEDVEGLPRGTISKDPPGAALVLILGLSLLGVSSCATVQPIVKDIVACAGPACADAATKIVPAVELVLECDAAAGFSPAALPACAANGLDALAVALGPDGWRVVGCIVNAIEKDTSKPEPLRLRASAARKLAARKANGR